MGHPFAGTWGLRSGRGVDFRLVRKETARLEPSIGTALEGLPEWRFKAEGGTMRFRNEARGFVLTVDTLRGYMERRPSGSPFLFPGKTKTGYAEIYNVEKTLRRACIRAGVRLFTPHQLRHYFATEMLKGGAKLEVVGRILGHSSIGITADIYRFVETGEMHEAVERFGPQNGRKLPDT